jgi:hypothetical protein
MTNPQQELERAFSPLAWILNFVWDTLRLMFWFFMFPILIIAWSFYNPAQAYVYFVNAIPLLWGGGSVTRGILVFFVILFASLFGRTMHKICWGIIKLALLAGVIGYVYLVFKLA